jgi:hypothetical protein
MASLMEMAPLGRPVAVLVVAVLALEVVEKLVVDEPVALLERLLLLLVPVLLLPPPRL